MKPTLLLIKQHKLEIYAITLLVMAAFAALIYPAATHDAFGWTWFLLGGIVFCNLVILFFP